MNCQSDSGPRVKTALRVRLPNTCEDFFTNVVPHMNLLTMGGNVLPYNSDHLFGCGYPQEVLFELSARPILDKFIRAEDHVSIIAFGPPFCGKSYTLFGPGVHVTESAVFYGFYPRFATYLFSQYDPSVFVGVDPQVKVYVAFYEIYNSQIKDLLKNNVLTGHESNNTGNKTEELLGQLEYELCGSTRHMILCLDAALRNTQQHQPCHLFANVTIEQPCLRDGQYVLVKTTAVFAEIGNTFMEHPCLVNCNTAPVLVPEDRLVLNALIDSHGGTFRHNVPATNHLFNSLKSSFNKDRAALVYLCVSPSSTQCDITSEYLPTLSGVYDLRKSFVLLENLAPHRNKNVEDNKANNLICEAESLLSRLSVSKSISDEDQEKLKNWLHMKKECEDDSLNAQSHAQLECIEEVTESEEEIASSDEKMSESPMSLDNSVSESDQEEGDSKVGQLSDNNFLSSLDNMCDQFNTFVDKFVDSFKAKTSLSPGKERKRDYSAARRGGMPELPKVNELQAKVDSIPGSLEFVQASNQSYGNHQSDDPSTGCIRKTTVGRETKTTHGCRDRKAGTKAKKDRVTDEDLSTPVKGTNANAYRSKKPSSPSKRECDENDPDSGKDITWYSHVVDPADLKDYDIYSWLEQREEDLKEIRSGWASCINEMATAEMKGKDGEVKAFEVERNKHMFYAVAGIEPFLDMMKEILATANKFEVDGGSYGFNHIIRWHRHGRQDYTMHKNRLDANVKNKTATEEECRDYLMADEMIETLDTCIEFLNYIIINKKPPQQKLPNTAVGKDLLQKLKSLTAFEMKNLMFKYFMKVVDLRENSKQMESTIAEYEQKLEFAQSRIHSLTRSLQEMRTQQSQLQAVAKYSHPAEGAYGSHAPTSAPLALTEGSKSKRGPCIPHQNLSKLQVTKAAPPPKVTIKHNKLIIEKPNNQK